MNKLFTKITSLALGAAMMIGVGVSVGSAKVSSANAVDSDSLQLRSCSGTSGNIVNGSTTIATFSAPDRTVNNQQWRIASGKDLTITPASGIKINSITFKTNSTASYMPAGNYVADGGQSTSFSFKDGTTSTLSGLSVASSIVMTLTSAARITHVGVSYTESTPTLDKPSPSYADGYVTWGAVKNATSYSYSLDSGSAVEITTTSIDVQNLSYGAHSVSVVAKASGYNDSLAGTCNFSIINPNIVWHDATVAHGTGSVYDCTVNSKSAIRIGKSSGTGTMTVTVPANAVALKIYAAAWNGGNQTFTFNNTTKISPYSFEATPESVISGTATDYEFDEAPHLFAGIALSNLTDETTFEITSAGRVVFWGVQYGTEPVTTPDVTLDPENELHLSIYDEFGTITATPNEYLENPQYTWGIKSGSDDCVTLTSNQNVATVSPKGTAWSATATITLHVTSSTDTTVDLNKEIAVKVNKESNPENPFTVAVARQAYAESIGTENAYVKATIVSVVEIKNTNCLSYYISDDGTATDQMLVYSGKGLNGAGFSSTDDLIPGQHVIIKGNITEYSSAVQIGSFSIIYSFDTHTVTYDAGEGSVTPTTEVVTCGGSVTLPTPTRQGYSFDGWKKGSEASAGAGTVISHITADATYVAQWSKVNTLDKIVLSGTYQTDFSKNDTFNHDGLVVMAQYVEDVEDKDISATATYSTPDMTTIGKKTITITYSEGGIEKQTSYEITVHGIVSDITTNLPETLRIGLGSETETYTAVVVKDEDVECTLVWISSDITVATVSNGKITASSSNEGTAIIRVFADIDGDKTLDEGEVSKSCSVTVADVFDKSKGEYHLVTDLSELSDGASIAITDSNCTFSMKDGFDSTKNNIQGITVEGDTNTNTISSTYKDSLLNVTLEKVADNTYYLKVVSNDEDKYLYAASSSGNQLKASSKETAGDNGKFLFSLNEGVFSIVAQGSNIRNRMRANPNNGSPIFACYNGTTGTAPVVYVFKTYTEEATAYADKFLKANGSSFAGCSATISAWDTLKTAYGSLTDGAKALFAGEDHIPSTTYPDESTEISVKHAVCRYDDAVTKHSELRGDNEFMGRVNSGKLQLSINLNPIALFGDNGTATTVIIIISVIGVSALGGFFFLRKRKEI